MLPLGRFGTALEAFVTVASSRHIARRGHDLAESARAMRLLTNNKRANHRDLSLPVSRYRIRIEIGAIG